MSATSHSNLELLNSLYQLSDIDINDTTENDEQILMVRPGDSTEPMRVLL